MFSHIIARVNEEITIRKTVGSSLSSKDEFASKKLYKAYRSIIHFHVPKLNLNVKKIPAVINATYAVAKRKPEKKIRLPGFEP